MSAYATVVLKCGHAEGTWRVDASHGHGSVECFCGSFLSRADFWRIEQLSNEQVRSKRTLLSLNECSLCT
jgi:hypothetical protein